MRRFAVAAGAVAVLALGGVAWAAIPNADGNIYACYSNGDGSVRVKSDPAAPCPKNWSPLNWTAGQPDVPVTTTYIKREVTTVPPNFANGLATVRCDQGDVAVSGGVLVHLDSRGNLRLTNSFPASDNTVKPIPWTVDLVHDSGQEDAFTAFVVCQHTE